MHDNHEKVLLGNNVSVRAVGGGGDLGDFFNLWHEFPISIKIAKNSLKKIHVSINLAICIL